MAEEKNEGELDFLSLMIFAALAVCPLLIVGYCIYYSVTNIMKRTWWGGGLALGSIVAIVCLFIGIVQARKLYLLVKNRPKEKTKVILAIVVVVILILVRFTW